MASTDGRWTVKVRQHPGSRQEDIDAEPDWGSTKHDHYTGYRNRYGRKPGLTHAGDEQDDDATPDDEALEAYEDFKHAREEVKAGHLLNFQDVVHSEKDLHLDHPANRSLGWRFMLNFTEKEIKEQPNWPANVKKRKAEEEEQKKQQEKEQSSDQNGDAQAKQADKTEQGPATDKQKKGQDGDPSQDPQQHEEQPEHDHPKLSPQEAALLEAVKHEQEYISKLKINDGLGHSNVKNRTDLAIDEADQFTPDNWVPRSGNLIRHTGKHPINAEAPLSKLFEGGFITPNELHYVRNHGSVPRLLWEFHRLKISFGDKSKEYTMEDLKNFSSFNLPVLLACDGNRRKELNMIKKTTGFDWGPGGIGCAYWKGPMLREILLESEVLKGVNLDRRWFIHFRGADDPNQVHYETSIPLEYVMDATNDVLLAHEMNDVPIPPDHGYPLRVIIPGYVGARHVKWLKDIWISDKENDSYFHIHDNRILPSFVDDSNSELAKFFFNHPDTAIYEQSLQSIIAFPAQDERIELKDVTKGQKYRIRGFAYNGRGDEVQRIEVSLDQGNSWLYCIRTFPEAPIRHGKKFWTWCFWHVDVPVVDMIRATGGITVRALDVKKMTQPERPVWTLSGMMNNAQYVVKPEMKETDDLPAVIFRHPVQPSDNDGGWMKNSMQNKLKEAEQKPSDAPKKQFTRAEIEKHDHEKDCWIVIDGCVYDATSVLGWHPGGAAAIMSHAGVVHEETTGEFAGIHDEYAYKKLNECILGVVTDKAKRFMAKAAEEARNDASASAPADQALQKHRWTRAKLIERRKIGDSSDTEIYRFQLPEGKKYLGIGTSQHVEFGFHLKDKMLIRAYTPIKPVLPKDCTIKTKVDDAELHDGSGVFELVVKTYFPDENQPGGAMSSILHEVELGEDVEIRGPTGDIIYLGNGKFEIYGEERTFKRVSLVLGGTGLTPGYSFVARSCIEEDQTEIRIIDANKSEHDILLKEQLDGFEKKAGDRVKITHILSHPSDAWKGLKGHVDEGLIKKSLFPPSDDSLVLLCGPPGMIQKAALPALQDWGYKHDSNMFGL